MSSSVCELVLVRHGETDGESAIRLNGATDVGLCALGKRQMARVREALAGERFDRVLTSPLRRAQASAAIAFDVPAAIVPGFREIDFGQWEGRTLAEVRASDPAGYAAWSCRDADFTFPGGESREGFRRRIAQTARVELAGLDGRVAAVLHKGVIKVAIATLVGLDAPASHGLLCELGSIHRLRRLDGRWSIELANGVSHLGPDYVAD